MLPGASAAILLNIHVLVGQCHGKILLISTFNKILNASLILLVHGEFSFLFVALMAIGITANIQNIIQYTKKISQYNMKYIRRLWQDAA
jgi:hypothetical protein